MRFHDLKDPELIQRRTDCRNVIVVQGTRPPGRDASALLTSTLYWGAGVTELSRRGFTEVAKTFNVGDHVRWNSEAGRVSGVISKKLTRDTKFKGYTHHASREAPQYLIKSDKTEHIAVHKGIALRLIPAVAKNRVKPKAKKN